MNKKFLMSLVILGAAAFFACSDDATNAINSNLSQGEDNGLVVTEDSWHYSENGVDYIISTTTGIVTDAQGNQVGTITYVPGTTTGSITALDGSTLVEKVDVAELPVVTPTQTSSESNPTPSQGIDTPTSSNGNNGLIEDPIKDKSSSSVNFPANSSAFKPSSSSNEQPQQQSSSSVKQDLGNVTVSGSLDQTVAKNASISKVTFSNVESEPTRTWKLHFLQVNYDQNAKTYTIEGSVPDYWTESPAVEEFTFNGKTIKFTLTVSGVQQQSSSSVQQQSSSSVRSSSSSVRSSSSSVRSSSSSVRSSSSSVRSSSSVAQSSSSMPNGSTPVFKKVAGGKSGSGYATRYWDSCKPHCAWKGKGGPATTPTKTCHADGSLAGPDEKSACDGGSAGTCLSQIPQIVNDNVAYAFAASPGGENDCGRCFLLEFTGEGKDGNNARVRALKGKQLVIISSNIGYDVAGGQFDLMIPGGGVGIFSGCKEMGLSCAGAQYGGLLTDCERAGGGDAKIKQCLIDACGREYANKPQAKEGCLFMATWMNAASTNPKHNYYEVECPQELLNKW